MPQSGYTSILVLSMLIESSSSLIMCVCVFVFVCMRVCCYCCSNNQSICNDNCTGRKCTHTVAGCQLVCNTCGARGAKSSCANQPAGTIVHILGADYSFRTASHSTNAWIHMAANSQHSCSPTTPAKPLCTDGCCTISTESKSVSMKRFTTNYLMIE